MAPHREGRLGTADGLSLYYRDYAPGGAGAPVVCLPGFWRSSRDFAALASHLSHDRRVITPDMRGRGRSDRSPRLDDYRFERLLQDIRDLLDTLAVGPAVFVGTTLGSLLALELANTDPDRVLGIVMNDAGPEGSPTAAKRMAAFAKPQEISFEDAVELMRAANEPYCTGLTEEDYEGLVYRGYRRTESGGFVRDFDPLINEETARLRAARPDFWREYAALSGLPILVVKGENSDYLSAEVSQRMLRENPAARFVVVANRGHPPFLDEPDAVSAIRSFLSQFDRL